MALILYRGLFLLALSSAASSDKFSSAKGLLPRYIAYAVAFDVALLVALFKVAA